VFEQSEKDCLPLLIDCKLSATTLLFLLWQNSDKKDELPTFDRTVI